MSEEPRYPDLNDKDLKKQVEALSDYCVRLQRYVRFALNNIDEKNMTLKTAQDFAGKVSYTDLATEGSTEINGGNITTGEINAVDINGVNIYGCNIDSSKFGQGSQNSEQSHFDVLEQEYGILNWYRYPQRYPTQIEDLGKLGLVDEAPYLYLKFNTNIPLKINGANLQYAAGAHMVVTSNANTSLIAGQETTINTTVAARSFVPNGEFYIDTPSGSSPSIYAAKSGVIEISGSYDISFSGTPLAADNGYVMLWINGAATNMFTRFLLNTGQAQFAPYLVHVNAGDRINIRINPISMNGTLLSGEASNRTMVKYISYD